jgi:hypothetical protein
MAFAGGAVTALMAERLLQPFMGQAAGRARAAMGADPFAWLDQDHAFVLGQLRAMAESASPAQRMQRCLRVKRALVAHSLAEENALYPLLHDKAGERELTNRLYAGHAEIKMRLHALEEIGPRSVAWVEGVNVLRRAVEEHVAEEERAFEILRGALDREGVVRLAGALNREKQMAL